MQDPLKQGLKLQDSMQEHTPNGKIRMQDPLKQGLKQIVFFTLFQALWIRMQDPLKQGLKLVAERGGRENPVIRMQDPLKQGLKQEITFGAYGCTDDSNARSIKTRIETKTGSSAKAVEPIFECKIH